MMDLGHHNTSCCFPALEKEHHLKTCFEKGYDILYIVPGILLNGTNMQVS